MPCHTYKRLEDIREGNEARYLYPWLMQKLATYPGEREPAIETFNSEPDCWGDVVGELCHQCTLLGDCGVFNLMINNPDEREGKMLVGWWETHKKNDGRVASLEFHEKHLLEYVEYSVTVYRAGRYNYPTEVDGAISAHPEMRDKIRDRLIEVRECIVKNSGGSKDPRTDTIDQILEKHGWMLLPDFTSF